MRQVHRTILNKFKHPVTKKQYIKKICVAEMGIAEADMSHSTLKHKIYNKR